MYALDEAFACEQVLPNDGSKIQKKWMLVFEKEKTEDKTKKKENTRTNPSAAKSIASSFHVLCFLRHRSSISARPDQPLSQQKSSGSGGGDGDGDGDGGGSGDGLRRKFQPWRENETVLAEIR
ncbi:hypothetical protein HZH66_002153 [Vespula vulgaris]|uniref:Uncharacterized protein n=1 Tax=Vespula vulgaris TaxID=7454 RepID=A0A834KIW1_VESVU|nr:hypothetical protein HZH66_002153 [Vespula vulgaris]